MNGQFANLTSSSGRASLGRPVSRLGNPGFNTESRFLTHTAANIDRVRDYVNGQFGSLTAASR